MNVKDFVSVGMKRIDIPEAEYAVFTVPEAADAAGLHENVQKDMAFYFQ